MILSGLDYFLYRSCPPGRLCRAEGKEQETREHVETAERMSEEMGYHRGKD